MRDITVCSVDPPGCTDIDDALHCRPLSNGNFEVIFVKTLSPFYIINLQSCVVMLDEHFVIRHHRSYAVVPTATQCAASTLCWPNIFVGVLAL